MAVPATVCAAASEAARLQHSKEYQVTLPTVFPRGRAEYVRALTQRLQSMLPAFSAEKSEEGLVLVSRYDTADGAFAALNTIIRVRAFLSGPDAGRHGLTLKVNCDDPDIGAYMRTTAQSAYQADMHDKLEQDLHCKYAKFARSIKVLMPTPPELRTVSDLHTYFDHLRHYFPALNDTAPLTPVWQRAYWTLDQLAFRIPTKTIPHPAALPPATRSTPPIGWQVTGGRKKVAGDAKKADMGISLTYADLDAAKSDTATPEDGEVSFRVKAPRGTPSNDEIDAYRLASVNALALFHQLQTLGVETDCR
eukprot:CAMPEP_0177658508 /NCGR_PEP_ID=MMETSP0447-20121125/16848_1 /TAXON_ID=0 /ORGANISM="Stygamoeba regulata, Strain BSH-02190019" /LENGTH=306 /DNA_ID=CAMNT_0019163119 /DNA_START=284 /DNA_END=1205 /DNA_ORIENTATION=+